MINTGSISDTITTNKQTNKQLMFSFARSQLYSYVNGLYCREILIQVDKQTIAVHFVFNCYVWT